MSIQLSLDKAGRVVIPKSVREELRLEPGDRLDLDSDGEGFTLRPVRSESPLRKERGVWVFRSGRKIPAATTNDVVSRLRADRDRQNRGSLS